MAVDSTVEEPLTEQEHACHVGQPKSPGSSRRDLAGKPVLPETPRDFAALYETHSRAVYYLALRYLGDPAKAEDATHDVFLKAYRKWGEFRGEASHRTWLYRITVNHCHNLRQSWASRNLVSNADEAVWESATARTDSPLRVLETKELGQRIQTALDSLPKEYRLLLLLVADQELSYDEVATLTGQTADAVRGKLHRARKAFGALFAKTDQGRYEAENKSHSR